MDISQIKIGLTFELISHLQNSSPAITPLPVFSSILEILSLQSLPSSRRCNLSSNRWIQIRNFFQNVSCLTGFFNWFIFLISISIHFFNTVKLWLTSIHWYFWVSKLFVKLNDYCFIDSISPFFPSGFSVCVNRTASSDS